MAFWSLFKWPFQKILLWVLFCVKLLSLRYFSWINSFSCCFLNYTEWSDVTPSVVYTGDSPRCLAWIVMLSSQNIKIEGKYQITSSLSNVLTYNKLKIGRLCTECWFFFFLNWVEPCPSGCQRITRTPLLKWEIEINHPWYSKNIIQNSL